MSQELLNEFSREFAQMKLELGFSTSFEELDDIFFLQDLVLSAGFVSPKLSRMVCGRIRDTFSSWLGQLQGWLMPGSSVLLYTEVQAFSDADQKLMQSLASTFMVHILENSIVGITKDRSREAAFIDRSVELWRECSPKLVQLNEKARAHWQTHLLDV